MNSVPSSPVVPAATASSRPIRRTASRAAPRMSMFCPPVRSSGARSTTTASHPARRSQKARAGPAMLAPLISTLVTP